MAGRRGLLTADRIGIGMVIVGALAWPWGMAPLALVGFGVVGPPLLRELGLLRDHDDYTSVSMYRAGFHAMLVALALLLVNLAVDARAGGDLDSNTGALAYSMIEITLFAFAVSYVVQYWGPRTGTVRVLLGGSGFVILRSASISIADGYMDSTEEILVNVGSYLVIAAIFGVVAWMTHLRSRAGGIVLVTIAIAWFVRLIIGVVGFDSDSQDPASVQEALMLMVWVVCVLGGLGVGLLRSPDESIDPRYAMEVSS